MGQRPLWRRPGGLLSVIILMDGWLGRLVVNNFFTLDDSDNDSEGEGVVLAVV